MSTDDPTHCQEFDAHAEELALGQLHEPLRSRLLAHAAECAHCHAMLDGLGAVVDRLLLAAPQMEPPAGFENRALDRLDAAAAGLGRRRGPSRVWTAIAAAAVLVVVAAGVLAVVRFDDVSTTTTATTATVVSAGGDEVGSVSLIADPTPHVLVVIDEPRPIPGVYGCDLQLPDGTWQTVGSWDREDIATGVWAVGVDPALLAATAMRITDDDLVLATATFG